MISILIIGVCYFLLFNTKARDYTQRLLDSTLGVLFKKRRLKCQTVFRVGDRVEKVTGEYPLPGVIVSLFTTTLQYIRVVVEYEPGILSIYTLKDIRRIEETGNA